MASAMDAPAKMAATWAAHWRAHSQWLVKLGDAMEAEIDRRTADALDGLATNLRNDARAAPGLLSDVEGWDHAAQSAEFTGELAWGQSERLAAKGRDLDAKCCREISRAMTMYARACLAQAGREVTVVDDGRRRRPGS